MRQIVFLHLAIAGCGADRPTVGDDASVVFDIAVASDLAIGTDQSAPAASDMASAIPDQATYQDLATPPDLGPVGPCAVHDEPGEHWPEWTGYGMYDAFAQDMVTQYVANKYDWRIFYEQTYMANGDYLDFAVSKPFNVLGPSFQWGPDGVPMTLVPDGTFHYNPVSVSQFALYHHSLYMRGQPLASAFWAAVDRLLAIEGPDGALRYDYDYPPFKAGWTSALAQGHVLSVFARAYTISRDPKYLEAGARVLTFLLKPFSQGGVLDDMSALDPTLSRYLFLQEYPAATRNYTLNGFMFTILGLYDWANLVFIATDGSPSYSTATQYFQCGVQTISHVLPYYEVGGFSVYNMQHIITPAKGPFMNPWYHQVHVGLLQALFSITHREQFSIYERLWASEVNQPVPQ